MSYVQIGDVLGKVRRFHDALSSYFGACRDRFDDPRSLSILEVIRDQERQLSMDLERIDQTADEAIRRTWLQFDPGPELWSLARSELDRELESAQAALKPSMELDGALLALYRRLSSAQIPPRMRSLFGELATRQEYKLKSRALWAHDAGI